MQLFIVKKISATQQINVATMNVVEQIENSLLDLSPEHPQVEFFASSSELLYTT